MIHETRREKKSAINLAMDEIFNKKARKKSQRSRLKSFSVIAESWIRAFR